MAEGVFQTDRLIFHNQIWKHPAKFRLFFYIYGNAVFAKDGIDIEEIHVGRGQFLRSYRNLIDDLEYLKNRSVKRYSISYVKKLIDELTKEKRIEIESTRLGTLFTVLNYEEYQGFERFEKDNQERHKNRVRTEREQSENNNKNVKNVKKEKNVINTSSKIFADDSLEINLTNQLIFLITANNPNFKKPNVQKWASDFDKIIRIDKRDPDEVIGVMTWAKQDNFWKSNILSPSKLREKYDTLFMQMNSRSQTKHIPKGFESIKRYVNGGQP
ncbi:hypothetical protein LPY66_18340 [Dehalobacter sp. DCM]|uniref:hypothetical protein n=1 Tax=Dehalobacter sp. DCM TaxID=2907827 RepID=UPI003081E7A1|nr:hypothetical protein LPY66_18340 [Dehalobacter sp. DCM]